MPLQTMGLKDPGMVEMKLMFLVKNLLLFPKKKSKLMIMETSCSIQKAAVLRRLDISRGASTIFINIVQMYPNSP